MNKTDKRRSHFLCVCVQAFLCTQTLKQVVLRLSVARCHHVLLMCKTRGESVTFRHPAAAHSLLSFVSIRPRKLERRRADRPHGPEAAAAETRQPVKQGRLPGSILTAFLDSATIKARRNDLSLCPVVSLLSIKLDFL